MEPQFSPEGKTPLDPPFNILTALYSFKGPLSVDEVAQLFRKSPDTVYRMARKGEIPSYSFGGSVCFDPSVLVVWLVKKQPQLAIAARHFQKAA